MQAYFRGCDLTLMTKIKRLVLAVPPIELKCKQTAPSKRQLDSELPHKPPTKKKAKKQAESLIIDLDGSESMSGPANIGNHNNVKEIHWANFGKQTLTTVDRSITLKGMVTSHFNNVMCVCAGEQLHN